MKKILFVMVIVFALFLIGCNEAEPVVKNEVEKPVDTIEDKVEEAVEAAEPEVVTEPEETLGCIVKADCTQAESCIEGVCGKVSELYETEGCMQKCNFDSVVVKTNDGESYTLNRGKGGYTSAGALAWKLVGGPDYCPGDKVIVPIKLDKISYGKTLEQQTIVLSPGEKSDLITHPTVKSVSFTLEIESVNEVCS